MLAVCRLCSIVCVISRVARFHALLDSLLPKVVAAAAELCSLLEQVYGESALVYILATEKKHSAEKIMEKILEIAPHKKEDVMTAAMQLEQRGMERGRQEGMDVSKMEIVRQMLQKGMDKQMIQELTGLAISELEKA